MDDWEQHFLLQSLHTLLRYPELARAQQYAIAPEISQFCLDTWASNEMAFDQDGRAVSPCVVPSDNLLLFVSDGGGRKVTPLHLLTEDDVTRIWRLAGSQRQLVGGFRRTGDIVHVAIESHELSNLNGSAFGFFTSLLVAMIGHPRFVSAAGIATRQTRRRLQAQLGVDADKLQKIVWQLGEPHSERPHSSSGRRMPLHFRRGHWRRAEPHHKGAEYIRLTGSAVSEGWFQWIKEQWPGHPAYGVRLSVHAPKLNLAEFGHDASED